MKVNLLFSLGGVGFILVASGITFGGKHLWTARGLTGKLAGFAIDNWVVWKMTYTLQALGRWIDYACMTGISRAFGFNAPYSFMYRDETDVSLFLFDTVTVAWSMSGFILPPDRPAFQAGDWRWCLGQNVWKCDEILFHDTKVFFAGLGQPFYINQQPRNTMKHCHHSVTLTFCKNNHLLSLFTNIDIIFV